MKRSVPLLMISLVALAALGCFGPTAGQAATAFTHVRVVPMTRETVLNDQTVLVEGDRIVAIGRTGTIEIPEGAVILDGSGAYLLPGIADMHTHTHTDWEAWPVFPLDLYLANGVTTVRNFGCGYGDGATVEDGLRYALELRDGIEAGTLRGPTIISCGRRPGRPWQPGLLSPSEIVAENVAMGFDFLKVYSYVDADELREILAEAKAQGLYTSGHIPFSTGLRGALDAGLNEIAHVEELIFELVEFDRDLVLAWEEWIPYLMGLAAQQHDLSVPVSLDTLPEEQRLALDGIVRALDEHDAPVCTTMLIDRLIDEKLFELEVFLARSELAYMPEEYVESVCAGREKHQLQFAGAEAVARLKIGLDTAILQALYQAGISLLLGTDSGTPDMGIVPGVSIHDELNLLVEGGMSPYEALWTGTVNAARVVDTMGGEGDFGTIEVGKRADLILVAGNPVENVTHLRSPHGVMARGVWYSDEDLRSAIALPEG